MSEWMHGLPARPPPGNRLTDDSLPSPLPPAPPRPLLPQLRITSGRRPPAGSSASASSQRCAQLGVCVWVGRVRVCGAETGGRGPRQPLRHAHKAGVPGAAPRPALQPCADSSADSCARSRPMQWMRHTLDPNQLLGGKAFVERVEDDARGERPRALCPCAPAHCTRVCGCSAALRVPSHPYPPTRPASPTPLPHPTALTRAQSAT